MVVDFLANPCIQCMSGGATLQEKEEEASHATNPYT